jgi:hypothetical protein
MIIFIINNFDISVFRPEGNPPIGRTATAQVFFLSPFKSWRARVGICMSSMVLAWLSWARISHNLSTCFTWIPAKLTIRKNREVA